MKSTLFKFKSALLVFCMAATGIIANAQSFDWIKGLGGGNAEYGYDVAADDSGNVYVAGYFTSAPADFNPGGAGGTLTSRGGYDVFLAKYDAAGSLLWVKGMGGSSGDYGYGVAVDGSGNVYVTGFFASATADFNPGGTGGTLTNTGDNDVFLAKYDAGGNFLWAKGMGGSDEDVSYGVVVDGSGNAYITGYFASATADFNPGGTGGSLVNVGGLDVFLAKYDTGGSLQWAKSMGGSNSDVAYGIAADRSGNVYVTGTFLSANADFNPGGTGGALISAGRDDIFLAKYDATGSFLWAKGMGGSDIEGARSVAVDANDNVYLTGFSASAPADFNPGGTGGTLNTAGLEDVFVAKYDGSGSFLWVKGMGGAESDMGRAVTVDGTGNVYVTGEFLSVTAEFNPGGSGGELANVNGGGRGTADAFLAKYDPNGNYLWAKDMGGSDDDGVYGGIVDGSGNLYLTGYFGPAGADFNRGGSGGALTSEGSADAFMMRFACSDTFSAHLAVTLHCGESYTLGDSAFTVTGTYIQIYPNTTGCDSAITLDLTIIPLDKPIISPTQFLLSTSATYASYQWIRNDTTIEGATSNTHNVTSNGNYKVAVTNGYGCSDTSEGYLVTNVNVDDIHAASGRIRFYPNPADEVIYINSPIKVNVRIFDMAGRFIKEQVDVESVSIEELGQGVYLLHLTDEKGILLQVEKLVKEK